MKTVVSILCAAVLAGCGNPQPSPDAPGSGEVRSASALDLSGHYRIETLGSQRLTYALELSASDTMIWWEPGCAGQGLAYRDAPGGIEFYDARKVGESYAVCDIGFPEYLPDFWSRLAGVHKVTIGDDRSLRIEVDGETWVLRPTTDPLPKSLAGRWKIAEINGFANEQMYATELEADDTEIWWNPRCARAIVEYRMDGDRFELVKPAYQAPPPPKPGDTSPPEPLVVCAIGLPPHLPDALNAIRTATEVSRDARNNIVLTGKESRIVLTPLPAN